MSTLWIYVQFSFDSSYAIFGQFFLEVIFISFINYFYL